ncbi:M28 family peptidase [Chryseobacterium daecheongense]|uniref:Aminopeptidase YwaD n=1 Tax=Chryseobacterium daecheongense TaxID=192389 RepID=A0A3N0W3U2_9FLAO|nr:M20/M25/M40 family metallo-hydrolase [Chryseobacterium daecheongense]ROH99707.1 M28 family peptidase [Chryseobacterium daecheongense]TDX95376.1 aminopeptidase YwaD [Chryseobacterium daecheongense]
MKKIAALLLFSFGAYALQAQTFIQAYQNRANQVTQTNITTLLQEFGNLGVKTTGSALNTAALNWLKNKYLSYGYTVSQMVEDPFTIGSSTNSKNLIITKTGTVYPNKYVIICGHYDTIVGPGVSDNGSGTAILLEAARILKDIPTEYSIKFIHFSGEEQGLYGSSHYVNNVAYVNGVRQLDIKLVFNIDQVGGELGNTNNIIYCDEDQGSPTSNNAASQAVTQQLATCTALYSPLQTAIDPAYASDYMPFEDKGEVITGFYEYTRSYNEHTVNDTFANIDPVYVFNVGKAAVGALQHFAVATTSILGTEEKTVNKIESVKVYPNPAKDVLHIDLPSEVKNFKVEVTDMNGRLILNKENETKLNVSGLSKGAYLVTLKSGEQTAVRKILIEK